MKNFLLLVFLFLTSFSFSQTYSNLDPNKKDTTEYKYILPVYGAKTHALGFDLPYSGGIGINYIWQQSDIVISNLEVGFNGGDLYNIDELVQFNSVSSLSNGVNIRPDFWLFPFLNVYGIFAKAQSNTNVDVSIWIPRINDSEELFNIKTSPQFNTTSIGLGLTPTAGFFSGWIALDMNITWTDVDALDKSVFAFVFDPRIGKTFNFKKKERNFSVWVGGFRLAVKRDTKGSLPINEVLPTNEWFNKIDAGNEKVANAQIELDNWWESLTPIEQKNPVNIAKYTGNQKKLDLAGQLLNGAENAVDRADNSTVDYILDKKQKSMWNFMIGSQFQLNKHWMIRGEYGFLTSRQHVIIGLQYRFGI